MKVVLDEMLPAAVAGLLSGHDVATVKAAGYTGLSNGDLIRRAAADGFDVLVTADRNLPAQQNVPASNIAVVLVRGSAARQAGFERVDVVLEGTALAVTLDENDPLSGSLLVRLMSASMSTCSDRSASHYPCCCT